MHPAAVDDCMYCFEPIIELSRMVRNETFDGDNSRPVNDDLYCVGDTAKGT